MLRASGAVAVVALVLLAVVALGRSGPGAVAQDATPDAVAGHPLVGSWVVIDVSEPGDTPSVTVFTGDGIVLDAAAEGGAAGSWEPTGPRSAAVTFVVPVAEDEFAGSIIIRGTIEVDAAGDAFTSPYSYTVVAADGTVVDAGRSVVEATRVPVEPIEAEGTPLAAVPTWTVATPEASPAATPAG